MYVEMLNSLESMITVVERQQQDLLALYGGMNPESFQALTRKHEQDMQTIEQKLTEVRKKVHG
mgnify:CR=1 FL=1